MKMIQLMIFEPIFAFERFIAFAALIDLFVVHYLMLLKSYHGWEYLVAHVACLNGSRSMFCLVIFESVWTLELFLALKWWELCKQQSTSCCTKYALNPEFPHLVTIVNRLSVWYLMLFKPVTLIKSFKTKLALEFWLMGDVIKVAIRWCFRFLGLWLNFDCLINLRVLLLFMFLQIVLADECLITKRAIEYCWLHSPTIFNFKLEGDGRSWKISEKIHFSKIFQRLLIFFDSSSYSNCRAQKQGWQLETQKYYKKKTSKQIPRQFFDFVFLFEI